MQKQLNELTDDCIKLQNEQRKLWKRDTWNKDTQDMKEQFNKNMENLRKKEPKRNPRNKKFLRSNRKYS
jgi:hypothetical protein